MIRGESSAVDNAKSGIKQLEVAEVEPPAEIGDEDNEKRREM